MKLFQSVQENFATLGITREQSIRNNPFNARMLAAFSTYILMIASIAVFFFHDANTFWEYTNNIYNLSAIILIFISFVTVVFNMRKCFALIDSCAAVVAKSEWTKNVLTFTWIFKWRTSAIKIIALGLDHPKSKAIYDKTNRNIEKFSRIIYLAAVKVTPFMGVLPKACANLIVYFATNMDNKALELPVFAWYSNIILYS